MRSLDECRAEVFARSEKRIEKRRKIRWQVTAALAPLCLCIVLLTVLPMMSGPNKSAPMESDGWAGEAEYEVDNIDRQQATVIRKDGKCWTLSESRTEQLSQLVDSYLTDGKPAENQNEAPHDIEIPTGDGKPAENQKEADYEIEIPAGEGKRACCLLSGSYLTCDGQTVKLSQSRLQQLLELLQP